MKLWILSITHRHGSSLWVFDDYERAVDRVADWCREWWGKEMPNGQPQPQEDRELIAAYFEEMTERGEYYVIEPVTLNEG